jgi:Putative adhesin
MTTKTFAVTKPITLVARIGHGSFRVTAVDGRTEASVTLTARTGSSEALGATTVELNGATLQITGPRQGGIFDVFGARKHDAIDVEVIVPSGTALKISSFTADVTVVGRCGAADLASAASNVVADIVDGDLRLRVGSGNCQVGRISGSVHCRSGSGTVQLGEVGGAVSCASGSGRLEVSESHGAVRFRTGSGGATLDAIHGNVDLATGSGELRVGVPAGVSARLDLTTGAGQVDSQLPITERSSGSGRAVTIRARTGSGDVHLFRAAA